MNATDYYWIGGTGNWSDLSHWATTSGGNVTHAQIPTSEDNVIFDASSFTADGQTITFNNDIVFTRDMTFTGITNNINVIGGETVIISAFGSIDLGDRVNFDYRGIITFSGSKTDNVINFGNNNASREMYISGDGTWTLTEDLEVDSIFQVSHGNLTTNDQNIRTQYLYVVTDKAKNLELGNSEIEIWGRYGKREFYHEDFDTITAIFNTTNLTFDAGTSTINFSAPITEVRITGAGSVEFNNVIFSHNFGRNRIRNYQSDPSISWNQLRLNGSSKIDGIHSIQQLTLRENKVYRLESGRTFKIDAIEALGTCAKGIVITSSFAGSQTTIESGQNINLDFVTLRGIHGRGASFSATNSTNLGNNQSWSFTNSNSIDYYWIGGSGRWNNPNHWALLSGGPSSGCVPTGKDNVFFDMNSFSNNGQEVEINLEDVFVRNMTWVGISNNPDLKGPKKNSLHITGSLVLSPDMTHTFEGNYFFESLEGGNTITMNGQQFNREIHFNGAVADWTLQDDVFVKEELLHNSGTLITGGNSLDIWQYKSIGERPRVLDITNSYIETHDIFDMHGNAIHRPEWNIETNNYSSITTNSTIEFKSVYYASFNHRGEDKIVYNIVIFSSYGADIGSSNFIDYQDPLIGIDSCIINGRGNIYGAQSINYFKLSSGYDYQFQENNNFIITTLDANGMCDEGHITMFSSSPGSPANFKIDNNHILTKLSLQDIHNLGTGSLIANESIDNGNNTGWEINTINPRILYWVGNTGTWEDPIHWSLNSGGTGGECVPTSLDDVIFDENSFTLSSQSVYSDNNRSNSCHNMTWTNVFGIPNFGYYYNQVTSSGSGTDNINIHGSLTYDIDMNVNIYWHRFHTDTLDIVTTNGQTLNGIVMFGFGELSFIDDLTNWNFDHLNGSIIFDDITFRGNYFYTTNRNNTNSNLILQNSQLHIGRDVNNQAEFRHEGDKSFVDPGTSTLFLDGALVYLISGTNSILNKVISTNPSGTVIIGDRRPEWNKDENNRPNRFIKSLRLAGSGTFLGEITMDTLIGSPGKTYYLENSETQTVNKYLQLIGNNCTPIQLLSTTTGNLANISMPASSNHLVDFVEMRDINAIGGANFIAGTRSTDIAMSNRGWLFEAPPDFVETGFLGVDRALCKSSEITISAYNFSPGEQYAWSTGSTDTTLFVNTTGTYDVTVTFDNGCEIQDEIIILEPQDVQINLPNDTLICDGTILQLNGSIGIQGVAYTWQDSLKVPSRNVTTEGEYILNAEVEGCVSRDSLFVTVQEIPIVDIGADQTLCEGITYLLDATTPDAIYTWQDGSNEQNLEVNETGTYHVEVIVNGCSILDSVDINYILIPQLEIGNDTSLCEGDQLDIIIEAEATTSYTWQDGSNDTNYSITTSGNYIVNADDQGCTNTDSISVNFEMPPLLDLGGTKAACDGQDVELQSGLTADSYLWSTGETTQNISVANQGGYTLSIVTGACIVTDSVVVILSTFPIIDIGADTLLCEDESLELLTSQDPNYQYQWQDGTSENSFIVSSQGIYILSADNQGCITLDSIKVDYQEAPQLQLDDLLQACEGDIVTLSASVTADTYL